MPCILPSTYTKASVSRGVRGTKEGNYNMSMHTKIKFSFFCVIYVCFGHVWPKKKDF